MTTKQTNNFKNAPAGSLWSYKVPKLAGKWGEVVKFDPQPLLLVGLDEDDTAEKELQANEDFFIVDINFPIMKLKEELAIENKPANEIEYYDKVMATIASTEEVKVGWMFRDEANHLIPYKGEG